MRLWTITIENFDTHKKLYNLYYISNKNYLDIIKKAKKNIIFKKLLKKYKIISFTTKNIILKE